MSRSLKLASAMIIGVAFLISAGGALAAPGQTQVKLTCKPLPANFKDPLGIWSAGDLRELVIIGDMADALICTGLVNVANRKLIISYTAGDGCSNILCPARVADVTAGQKPKVIMQDMVCQTLNQFYVSNDGQELISCGLSSPLDGQLAP